MNTFENSLTAMAAQKYDVDGACRQETINDRLKRQLAQHGEQAQKIGRLLTLLERNPDFEELLNLTREVL